MNRFRRPRTLAWLFTLASLLAPLAVQAQLQSGNLYGKALDQQGNPLPGVTVTLDTGAAPQVQVTGQQGEFRFLGLPPGAYKIKAELQSFSTVEYPNVVVNVGRNTEVQLTLNAAVEDVITVTAEVPLLDERKVSKGTTYSQTELSKIPTGRDPWAVLQSSPGVLTDRINIGGNESGQQSTYVGPGSAGTQAVWALDGVVITDMFALGASPTYYDFDAFEEMQVTTGGSDASLATGGVTLNMVTKRGTNEWRASGRYYYDSGSLQSNNPPSDSTLGQPGLWRSGSGTTNGQASFKQGNRIDKVTDYGAELGGPIVKDKLWIWGSYGATRPSLLTIADVSDKTQLDTYNLKLNWQIAPSNSLTLFGFRGEKKKQGRNAGPTRPQETTWDQTGPTPVNKVEDTHIFSSTFFLTGLYSWGHNEFNLVPEGGLAVTSYLDESLVSHNSFLQYGTTRPQTQARLDSSVFVNTGAVAHELKFGAGHRVNEVNSLSTWAGAGRLYGPGLVGNDIVVALARPARIKQEIKYDDLWAQDTLTTGNLTVNAGLRYDRQGGKNKASSVSANTLFPEILPAASFAGGDFGFQWTNLTPRLGVTYALGKDRKTLLRASYSRFADQLGGGVLGLSTPFGYAGGTIQSYAYFYTTNPGDGHVTRDQVLTAGGPLFTSSNYDPRTGGLLISSGIDKNLKAPLTDELTLSAEHALLPEFVVGANLTYRKLNDVLETDQLVFDGDAFSNANLDSIGRLARRSDYVAKTVTLRGDGNPRQLPNGQTYTYTYYTLKPGVSTRGGYFLSNGKPSQTYKGASLTFTKRLSNRWMMRGSFNWSDWTWNIGSNDLPDPTELRQGGAKDGDIVLQRGKGNVYVSSHWSYSLNGLYQIAPDRPWGFNVAGSLTGRQGYPIPYYERVQLAANENSAVKDIQVTSRPDSSRLDDIRLLDLRVEKEFTFSDFGLTLGIDCFNATNENFVLQRENRLQRSASNNVQEITSPRIFRVGARFSLR